MIITEEMFQASAVLEDQFNQIQELVSNPYQMSDEEINKFQKRCENFSTLFNRWATNVIVHSKMPEDGDGNMVG